MFDKREPTLFEKIVLFKYKILTVKQITNTISLFEVQHPKIFIILKFSYMGNVQYHKLSNDELQKLKIALP